MATIFNGLKTSLRNIQAMIEPNTGAKDIISILSLGPTITKALNKKVSPIANPIIPDIPNQNQVVGEASIGKSLPNTIRWVSIKNKKVSANLVRLTTLAPMSRAATVKKVGPTDQQRAVPIAAISPKFLIKVTNYIEQIGSVIKKMRTGG